MEHEFWHKRWQTNDIGFHEEGGNRLLKQYCEACKLEAGSTILVPFCGKTRDIAWLISQGFKVIGIELNEQAVQQLFNESGYMPQIQSTDELTRYFVSDLTVYVGDFFSATEALIGPVDMIYDRGALVALPPAMRGKYAQHLLSLAPKVQQFTVCYQYDQDLFKGPPFNVSEHDIFTYYGETHYINRLHKGHIEGGFRGEDEVYEAVYRLTPR